MEETEDKTKDKKKHSWGELYETTKEMERNGEKITSPLLQKCFSLFQKLDNAKNINKARNIIENMPISEEEQNYINSSCLDGILLSINTKKPLLILLDKEKEYVETCKYYLSKGFVKRALWRAIRARKSEIVKVLLDYGADMNKQDIGHCEALFIAICEKDAKIVKILLDAGAVPDDNWDGARESVHDFEVAKLIFFADKDCGHEMLHSAICENKPNLAQFLFENGVKVCDDVCTEHAVYATNTKIWEILCKNGLAIDSELLEIAIEEENTAAVKVMLSYNINITEKCWDCIFKKLKTMPRKNSLYPILRLLLQKVDVIPVEHAEKILKGKQLTKEFLHFLLQKGVSLDTIFKNLPMFDCIKSLIETKYDLIPKQTQLKDENKE